MKKAIIFGIGGQDGFYLKELLQEANVECIGVSRSKGDWITGNVSERETTQHLIRQIKPDFIFHIAANSTTRHDVLFENHQTISTGTLNILESVYRYSPQSKVFLSGSGLQFENRGMPISEHDPFEATSPYSIARIQSVYAARYYRRLGIKTYVGYFFNHDSPLRSEKHLNQKIVMAVQRIAGGSNEKLEIGDISVRKEFSFAGDIMRAVWVLMQNEMDVYECVIGSGKAYKIEDWINRCFLHYNLDWRSHITVCSDFRKEYDILVSDPTTILSLGWRPKTSIDELADIMLNNK